jgi:hypothetical protein
MLIWGLNNEDFFPKRLSAQYVEPMKKSMWDTSCGQFRSSLFDANA